MRSEGEIVRAVERHGDTVRRLCMVHLKNYADTEDIFQTVFLKYALSPAVFESGEHERAWFIRVTINACKDLLKSLFRRRTVSIDEVLERPAPVAPEHREVLEAVLSLPRKYRAFQELQALDPSVTPEEVREMTMREIRQRIQELSGGAGDGSRQPGRGHHGAGHGRAG